MTLQDMENQYGQIDLQGRNMDLTGRQLDQQMAEQQFMQEAVFPLVQGGLLRLPEAAGRR